MSGFFANPAAIAKEANLDALVTDVDGNFSSVETSLTTLLTRVSGAVPLAANFTSGRAAAIDNLDAAVSTRAASATALSTAQWTNARATAQDYMHDASVIVAAVANSMGDLLNALTSRLTPTRATNLDNLDATVSTRAASATALSTATWTNARAGYLDSLRYALNFEGGFASITGGGGYSQFVASLAHSVTRLHIHLGTTATAGVVLTLNVAIGGAGSEVNKTVLQYDIEVIGVQYFEVAVDPAVFAKGSRLSASVTGGVNVTKVSINVEELND